MEGVFDYVLHLRSTVEIGQAIGEMIRSYNLDDTRVRKLWEGFTGHRLTEDDKAWNAYKTRSGATPWAGPSRRARDQGRGESLGSTQSMTLPFKSRRS